MSWREKKYPTPSTMSKDIAKKLQLSLANGHKLEYRLTRKNKNRHCYLYIKGTELEVRSPANINTTDIERFIRSKERWILNHLEKAKENKIDQSKSFLYKGIKYPVSINIDHDISVSMMEFNGKKAFFKLVYKENIDISKEINILTNRYYKQESPAILMPKVERWSKIMGLVPSAVSFRQAKTRWGSCSSKNRISLNIRLVSLPEHISDYIIVHELAHIRHKNHSKEFWKYVERYIPQRKAYRYELGRYML